VHVLAGGKGVRDGGGTGGYAGGGGGGGVDVRARATFIGNISSLIRATRGRGIVLSSEAQSVLGLRAPADVVNLLHVWGLSTDRATEGLGVLPRGVVVNEGLKHSGFRGVVDIVAVADRPQADVEMGEAGDDSSAKPASTITGNTKVNKDKKNRNQGIDGLVGGGGKKRKNHDDAEASVLANAIACAIPGGDDETQPISKRQAKKIKAALRKTPVAGEIIGT
jgi:ribonuclease P/MRP protein subunit RPP1